MKRKNMYLTLASLMLLASCGSNTAPSEAEPSAHEHYYRYDGGMVGDCSNDTIEYYKCNCGEISENIIHNSHNLTHYEAKAATFDDRGNIDYYYCSECRNYYLDAEAKQTASYDEVFIPQYQKVMYTVLERDEQDRTTKKEEVHYNDDYTISQKIIHEYTYTGETYPNKLITTYNAEGIKIHQEYNDQELYDVKQLTVGGVEVEDIYVATMDAANKYISSSTLTRTIIETNVVISTVEKEFIAHPVINNWSILTHNVWSEWDSSGAFIKREDTKYYDNIDSETGRAEEYAHIKTIYTDDNITDSYFFVLNNQRGEYISGVIIEIKGNNDPYADLFRNTNYENYFSGYVMNFTTEINESGTTPIVIYSMSLNANDGDCPTIYEVSIKMEKDSKRPINIRIKEYSKESGQLVADTLTDYITGEQTIYL